MFTGIEIKLGVLCGRCNTRNPFMGLYTKGVCYNCDEPMDIKKILESGSYGSMKYYFGEFYDIIYEVLALRGEGEAGMADPEQKYQFEYRKKFPYCPRCNTDFTQEALDAATGNTLTCANCNAAIPVRQKDESTREWDERIHMVINDLGGGKKLMAPASTEGASFFCMGCGAAMHVDGTKKFVECEHCGNSNQLPDSVWQSLHPVPKSEPFFLVIKENALLHAEARGQILNVEQKFKHGFSFAFEDVQNFEVPQGERLARLRAEYDQYFQELLRPENRELLQSGLTRKIDSYLFSNLVDAGVVDEKAIHIALEENREAINRIIASYRSAPGSALAKLTQDTDERIRVLVAAHKNLPGENVAKLAHDESEEVRRIIAKREDLSEELITLLSSDDDDDVRIFVAKNKIAPTEVLKRLARDSYDSVRDAARENPNLKNSTKKGGFFSKLFG